METDQGIIMEKLKKHPNYKKCSHEDKQKLAYELTNPDKLRELFSHLLEAGTRLAMDIVREEDSELLHSKEYDAQHQRVKHSAARASHLPVKVTLQKLRRMTPPLAHSFTSLLKFEYGPFHVAVIVGDVTIEWGRGSLVDPRFDPIPEAEFVANVCDQGEWLQRQGSFQRQMSLADRRRNSEEKLKVLYDTMEEKNQLIDRLIDVIVDYNCNKEYSVWNCNCQHFARDAMAALGIKKPIKFEGRLQERYEQLKRGNVKVPRELRTHDNLDEYVAMSMAELGRQDMEYLQCLYFKAHLPAIEKSEDPDDWVCDVPTCLSTKLDRLIQERSIAFHQYLPDQTEKKKKEIEIVPVFDHTILPEHVFGVNDVPGKLLSNQPSFPAVIEMDEDMIDNYEMVDSLTDSDEVAATGFMSMSLDDQHKLAAKFSGYRDQVILKYRDHPDYMKEMEEECVDALTEGEKFHQHYFSTFVDRNEKCIIEVSEDHKRRANGEISWERLATTTSKRFDQLCKFPMNLIYRVDFKHRKSRQSILETPLLVSLQVDDHTLEWVKAGLVIPRALENTAQTPVTVDQIVIVHDLSQQSEWSQHVAYWKTQIDLAIANKDEDAVIAVMYALTEKRESFVTSLIKLMVNYNRHSQYHKKDCNNAQFMEQAMKELGIANPPVLHRTLKRQLETIAPNSTVANRAFKTHFDLDMYAFENIGGKMIGRDELEFLVGRYFVFHMENWKVKAKKDWNCTEPTCQLMNLIEKM